MPKKKNSLFEDPSGHSLFVDTSGWACYLDDKDEFHSLVTAFIREKMQERWRFVTTNYVLAELVPVLTTHSRIERKQIIARIDEIKADPRIEVIHIDQTLDSASWKLLRERDDKKWSLVDTSSIIYMKDNGMYKIITTDAHFAQAGLTRVPEGIGVRRN